MFNIISVCKGGGYMYCRTDPKHPKANAKGLYPLHRVLMENKLGRILRKDEHVHHKNEDKNDNSIDNLEVLLISEHAKLHIKNVDDIILTCPVCKVGFSISPSQYRAKIKRSKRGMLFCSLTCSSIK